MLYRRTVMKLAFGLAIGLGVAVSAAAALEDKEDGNSAQAKVTSCPGIARAGAPATVSSNVGLR